MHVFVCASVCDLQGRNSVKGGKHVKPGKNSIFLKKGKTVISVGNLEIFYISDDETDFTIEIV